MPAESITIGETTLTAGDQFNARDADQPLVFEHPEFDDEQLYLVFSPRREPDATVRLTPIQFLHHVEHGVSR